MMDAFPRTDLIRICRCFAIGLAPAYAVLISLKSLGWLPDVTWPRVLLVPALLLGIFPVYFGITYYIQPRSEGRVWFRCLEWLSFLAVMGAYIGILELLWL